MQLITKSNIYSEFERLIEKYSEIFIATAWATTSLPIFSKFEQNSKKVKFCIVGLHFYQTHPDFISTFFKNKNFRYIKNAEGVFHPKLYLFKNNEKDWECVIGSANFTSGGFLSNDEISILFSSTDAPKNFLSNIETEINRYWKLAAQFTTSELDDYRELWEKHRPKIGSLSAKYRRNQKGKLSIDLQTIKWEEYYRKVTTDDRYNSTEQRKLLLSEVNKWFNKYQHFSDMPDAQRTAIAGFHFKPIDEIMPEPNWGWFGSMQGSGNFKKTIKDNNKFISDALDAIPLTGDVDKKDFELFRKKFMRSFNYKNPLAVATRLLCMKRPDFFVGINKANQRALCEAFDAKKTLRLEDYWDEIIAKLTNSNWWKENPPKNQKEKIIYNYRAAFLDTIYYESMQ